MYVYMGLYGLLISNNPNNPNANKENMKNLPDRLYKIICKYSKDITKIYQFSINVNGKKIHSNKNHNSKGLEGLFLTVITNL